MKSRTPVLDNFARNLNREIETNDFLICHRKDEIDFIINCFNNSVKRSVLIVGDSNIGKKSILYGVLEHQKTQGLSEIEISDLDFFSLLAGTKYRGQYEERVKAVESELVKNTNVILYIENFKLIYTKDLGAFELDYEATGPEKEMDLSIPLFDILKNKISKGKIVVVTTLSKKLYLETIKEVEDLTSYFHILHLSELDNKETLDVLMSHKKRLEDYHKVVIDDTLLGECVELANLYFPKIKRPQNGLNILDSLGSYIRTEKDKDIPPKLKALREELKKVKSTKNNFVKNQQYEEAADARDLESKVLKRLEVYDKKLENKKIKNPASVDLIDLYTMLSKMLDFDINKIKRKEPRSIVNEKTDDYFKEKFQDFDLDNKEGIIIENIPDVLKTCLQQYILYFREFLFKVKGVKIFFNVSIIESGLRLEIKPGEIGDEVKLQSWFNEYMEYIYEKEAEFTVNFEKKVNDSEAQIAMAELKNQIRYLDSQIELNKIAINTFQMKGQQVIPRLQFPSQSQFLMNRGYSDLDYYLSLLRKMIEAGKIKEVIDQLKDYSSHSGDLSFSGDNIIILKSKLSLLNQSKFTGEITQSEYAAQKQSIIRSILDLINQIGNNT